MARNKTDAEVEMEIIRLKNDDDVRLAQKYRRLKSDKMRKQMYQLRWLRNVGEQLRLQGITFENMEEMLFREEGDDIPEGGTT